MLLTNLNKNGILIL